jgi:beta-1,4-mannosyltransferase
MVTFSLNNDRSSLIIHMYQFVFLMIVNNPTYKIIENFINISQKIASDDDLAIIAGRNRAPKLVKSLNKIAKSDPRIRIYSGYFPEEEMQQYLLAGDVAVFAFNEILTSGTVILCISYGLPVIAPKLGCLPELITPDAGILYSPGDTLSFARGLKSIKVADLIKMKSAAEIIAHKLQWYDIAQKTKSVYQSCLKSQ